MGSTEQRRRSLRLKNQPYDHGSCFVTICAIQREWLFGEIKDGRMALNDEGRIVEEEWFRTPLLRNNVELDTYVIMPNHVHAIVHLKKLDANVGAQRAVPLGDHDDACRGMARHAPTHEGLLHAVPLQDVNTSIRKFANPQSGTLPTIIGAFKSAVTRRINVLHDSPEERVWQRNYFERVIRDGELESIRMYIRANPTRWEFDGDNL